MESFCINFGLSKAAVLIAILSAPDLNKFDASFTDLMPPPTVTGIKISFDKLDIIFPMLFLPYKLATLSRNNNSSAPPL